MRREVWSAVFEPIGVGCRPVTNRHGVEPAAPVARSRQRFGSGGRAFRLVVVAQDVRRALDAAKVRGASFGPAAPLTPAGRAARRD